MEGKTQEQLTGSQQDLRASPSLGDERRFNKMTNEK